MNRRSANYTPLRVVFRERYHIPDFQRGYAWGDEEISAFLSDLEEGILDQDDTTLGPLMTYEDAKQKVNVFDGQQRLTTLFCLLLACRNINKDHDQNFRNISNFLYTEEPRVVERSDGLHIIHQRSSIKKLIMWIYDNPDSNLTSIHKEAIRLYQEENSKAFSSDSSPRRMAMKSTEIGRVSNAYAICHHWLISCIGSDSSDYDNFLDFILYRTMFLVIATRDQDDAQRQFERSNSRGKTLNAFDLLKNSVFHLTDDSRRSEVSDIWQDISSLIERSKTKPDYLMRAAYIAGMPNSRYEYVVAKKARSWFREKEQLDFIKINPISFSNNLRNLWQIDERLSMDMDPWGNPCHVLSSIRSVNGRMDTIRPLIFALHGIPIKFFSRMIRAIESAVVVGHLSGVIARDMQSTFIGWVGDISGISSEEDCDFVIGKISEFIKKHRGRARTRLESMSEPLSRPLTIFFLKKAASFFDSKFETSSRGESALFSSYDNYEIEHIRPKKASALKNGDPVFRLGNLTLLEKPLNASVQDSEFLEKSKAYTLSHCRLTKQIVCDQGFGKNTRYSLATKGAPIFSTWTDDDIFIRQKFLADLLMEAWCFDDPSRL